VHFRTPLELTVLGGDKDNMATEILKCVCRGQRRHLLQGDPKSIKVGDLKVKASRRGGESKEEAGGPEEHSRQRGQKELGAAGWWGLGWAGWSGAFQPYPGSNSKLLKGF
jgi:hypothetical protein